ncbi:protein SMALL AUXIN UP-REGULATED RNA 51-like [Apium graveolens]|uniref:protein SMALL AUXIN UP-REGULATED RNA 51-like n=1 Tax=Apium graveolens TaxID=4045 RepID=UPI003D7B5BAF
MGLRKSHSSLRQAAILKQILKRCSGFAKKSLVVGNYYTSIGEQLGFPLDVPKGHFVAYVGNNRSRYVVPISLLTIPVFQALLQEAAEEFGFDYTTGIIIPCPEDVFLSLIDAN